MKTFIRSTLMLSALVLGTMAAHAQAPKPVLVVSLPSFNDVKADADFVGQLAGQPGAGQQMEMMLGLMTQNQGIKGLDKAKPMGLVVTSDGANFTSAAFLPVSNPKDLLTMVATMGIVPPPEEDSGALKVMAPNGDAVFVREQGGWTLVTQSKDAPLPGDPMKLLTGLSPEYDIAVRVYLQNVPADKKKSAIEQFKFFLEQAAAMQRVQGGDNAFTTLSQKNLQEQVKAIERLLNEADQITVGWKLDRAAKNTYLDFTFTAVPGSQLDSDLKVSAEAKTNFAGFLMPDAAATLSFCAKASPESIQQTKNTLDQLKQRAEQQIDNDANLKDEKTRAAVKNVLQQILDVVGRTVATGKSDGGAVLLLGEKKFQAAAGFYVADGMALESAVKNLIALAQGEPQFQAMATVKLDQETYQGVKFHQVSVKLPESADAEARKIFGDAVDIYFGAGKDAAYLALGKGSIDLVKRVIEQSAAQANKSVPPVQLSIALKPIVEFAASMNPEAGPPPGLAQMLSSGKDHILLTAKSVANGVTYRFEVEEGVLQAIGGMATGRRAAAQAAGNPIN